MRHEQIRHIIDTNLASLLVTQDHIVTIMTQAREGRRVKRRISTAMLAAALIVLIAATALAATVIQRLQFADQHKIGTPISMTVMEDTVYYLTPNDLRAWKPEWDDPRVIVTQNEMKLAGWMDAVLVRQAEKLLLISREEQSLVCLDEKNITQKMQLGEYDPIKTAVYQDGSVYVLCLPENAPSNESELYKIDVQQGTETVLSVNGIYELTAYQNGLLLALQYDAEQQTEKLVLMESDSGCITEVLYEGKQYGLSCEGLAYHRESDSIYAVVNGALCRWTANEWEVIKEYAMPRLSHSCAALSRGYVSAGTSGIQYIPIQPDEEEQVVLRIRGYMDTDISLDHDYQQQYPHIAISRETTGHMCAADVWEAVQTGDKTDLFHIDVDAGLLYLMKNGGAEALDSSVLMDGALRCAPIFQQALLKNGILYASISYARPSVYELSSTADMNKLPNTYAELFLQQPPYARLGWSDGVYGYETYVGDVLDQYMMECGEHIDFDTPVFRYTAEAFKNASWLRTEKGDAALVRSSFSLGNFQQDEQYAVGLCVDPANGTRYEMRVHVYVINPNSSHKAEAEAFLEYALSRRDAELWAILDPYHAEAAANPQVEAIIDQTLQEQRAYDAVNGIQTDEEALRARKEDFLNQPGHMLVTQDRLNEYRDCIFPRVSLMLHPAFEDISDGHEAITYQMRQAFLSYLQGEMELDALIERLNALVEA